MFPWTIRILADSSTNRKFEMNQNVRFFNIQDTNIQCQRRFIALSMWIVDTHLICSSISMQTFFSPEHNQEVEIRIECDNPWYSEHDYPVLDEVYIIWIVTSNCIIDLEFFFRWLEMVDLSTIRKFSVEQKITLHDVQDTNIQC